MEQQVSATQEAIVEHDGPELVVRTEFRTEVYEDESELPIFSLPVDADIDAVKRTLRIYRSAYEKGKAAVPRPQSFALRLPSNRTGPAIPYVPSHEQKIQSLRRSRPRTNARVCTPDSHGAARARTWDRTDSLRRAACRPIRTRAAALSRSVTRRHPQGARAWRGMG